MQVKYINNEGEGFLRNVEVAEDLTLGEFFTGQFSLSEDSSNFIIRVNNQAEERNYELQEGDKITVTPRKIAGATS